MARSRNIKPGLFKNEILGVADPIYTIIFQGLWVLADKEGRLEDRPLRIKAEIIPYREGIDVDIVLNWLACNQFIKRYKVNENNYIQVINFRKHQNPHKKEADSTIPAPEIPGRIQEKPVQRHENPDQAGLIPDSRFLIPDSLIPEKDLLSDSTESDQKEKPVYPESFEKFWIAYPKKEGKGAAYKSYQKIKSPRPTLKVILDSIETHSKTEKWKNKQYIPLPATFLNQRRWEDEFTPEDFTGTKQQPACRDNESTPFYHRAEAPEGYK